MNDTTQLAIQVYSRSTSHGRPSGKERQIAPNFTMLQETKRAGNLRRMCLIVLLFALDPNELSFVKAPKAGLYADT